MKKILNLKFVAIGTILLGSIFFIGQAFLSSNVSVGGSRSLGTPAELSDSLGWQTTNSLPRSPRFAAYANNSNYIYVIGGVTTSTFSSVQFAPFNPDGTIGSWKDTQPIRNGIRKLHGAAVSGNYIYVVGGDDVSSEWFPLVLYATINSDGSLSSWSPTNEPPEFELHSFSMAAYNGYLYIFGGNGAASSQTNRVAYATINADGTLDEWSYTTSLPTVRSDSAAVAYNNRVYVIGGGGPDNWPVSSVVFASINSDGALDTWNETTPLPKARTGHGAVVANGYVYVLAGNELVGVADTEPTASVIYAPINPDGSLGEWRNSVSLPSANGFFESVFNNGFIYGLSNNGSTSSVVYMKNLLRPNL